MTPLQLCEIFEEFPQTLFTTQAGASSSAAAWSFVTAVHCSDKENILSVAKYLSLLAGQNDHNGRPRAIRFGSDEGNNLKFKKVIPLPHLPIPSDTAQKKKSDPLVQSTSPVY